MSVWVAGGALTLQRACVGGAGSLAAALCMGGYNDPSGGGLNNTDEYDSSSWSSGGNLPANRLWGAGFGTQTAGAFAGGCDDNIECVQSTYEYNGSSWSSGGNLPAVRAESGAAGTQTAGLIIGGVDSDKYIVNTTKEYDGSSWSSGGNLSQNNTLPGAAGTQTAGLCFGGNNGQGVNITEKYDGSAWTTDGNLSAKKKDPAGTGTQTAGLCCGGNIWVSGGGPGSGATDQTEEYDGSSWSAGGTMLAVCTASAAAGSLSAGLVFGGTTCAEYVGTADLGEEGSASDAFGVSVTYTPGLSEEASAGDTFTTDMLIPDGLSEEASAENIMVGTATMGIGFSEEASASASFTGISPDDLLILNFQGGDGDTTWAEEAQNLTPDPSVTYGFEIDTAEHKFGISSLKGAGGVATLSGYNNLGYELPAVISGDFTLHGFVKFKGLSTWEAAGGSEHVDLLYLSSWGAGNSYINIGLSASSAYSGATAPLVLTLIAVDRDANPLVNDFVDANPFAEDTWHHVAVICHNRDIMYSIDGTILGTWTAAIDTPMSELKGMQIFGGALPVGSDFWVANFELAGYAKWTANFTPPGEAPRGDYYSFIVAEELAITPTLSWQFPKSIEDLFFIYDEIRNGWAVTNAEYLTLTDSVSKILCVIISEWITLIDTQTNNWNGKEVFTDTLNLYDIVSFGKALADTINESLVITDVATYKLIVGVLEHLGFNDLAAGLKTMAESSTDSLGLTDGAERGFNFTINEALSAVDTVSVVATFLRSLSDSIAIAETLSNINRIYGTISEALSFAEVITTKGALYTAVYDTIAMNVLVELADDIYECYVLNTPKFLPSMYSGFNFNSYCVFENRAFAANDDGIYELTGATDAGANISTGVIMSQTDFGMPNQKRFRRGYIGISGTSPVMVLETEDGSREAYAIDTNGKFVASHDLKSKKWKLSVANFDELDCIKLIPVILTK